MKSYQKIKEKKTVYKNGLRFRSRLHEWNKCGLLECLFFRKRNKNASKKKKKRVFYFWVWQEL